MTFSDSEKVRKSMPKWLPKVVVDAERHRRTPRTPLIGGKMVESKTSADIGDIGAEIGKKNMLKQSFSRQKKRLGPSLLGKKKGLDPVFLGKKTGLAPAF